MGPVQVLVVGFDRPNFSGEVLAEFARLRQAGIVRLLDLVVLQRTDDGELQTLAAPELDEKSGELATAVLGRDPRTADTASADAAAEGADLWSLADVVPPGAIAAVALIEHSWASPLVQAVRRAGGSPLHESWLAPDDVAVLDRLMSEHAR